MTGVVVAKFEETLHAALSDVVQMMSGASVQSLVGIEKDAFAQTEVG